MVERIMTPTEYARHKGVELKAVKRAIEEGRIPPQAIKMGSNSRKLIFVESADKCWELNTVINNQNEMRQKSLNLGDKGPGRKGPESIEPKDPTEGVGSKLLNYRSATEGFKAQLYRLEYMEKSGKLCKVEDVKKVAREMGSNIKSALENLPDKLAPILTAESSLDKVHKLLSDEIETVLNNLSRGNFDFLKVGES